MVFLHYIYLRLSCVTCICLAPPSWAVHLMCLLLFYWEDRNHSCCHHRLLPACSGTQMFSAPAFPPPPFYCAWICVCGPSTRVPFFRVCLCCISESAVDHPNSCVTSLMLKSLSAVCFTFALFAALYIKLLNLTTFILFHFSPVLIHFISVRVLSPPFQKNSSCQGRPWLPCC